MSGRNSGPARRPATKQAHLRKKLGKQKPPSGRKIKSGGKGRER